MNMSAKKILAARDRDLRVDLLRGFATWFLFLDHIPNNVVNILTLRNFGFAGATDVFVFIAGYGAALMFGKMALERGMVVTSTRILRRVWQLYAAYLVLFVIYIDVISNVAAQYANTELFSEYNVTGIVDHPIRTLMYGVMLLARPLNLDTLQLFVALMAVFPLVLWGMLRRPNITLAASIAVYAASRMFGFSLPTLPAGTWYFNPFCWQLLAVLGAWFALNGNKVTAVAHRLPLLRIAAEAYLLFALAVMLAAHVPSIAAVMSNLGFDPFSSTDKEDLALYRVVHLLALALLFTCWVPRDWPVLQSRLLQPVLKCGDEWLTSFCVGVFLSFAAHIALITGPNSVVMQMLVSAIGIATMTAVAYYISWSRRQDRASVLRAKA
jgi:hypothetical protein